jgi:hypothetical protein
MKRSLAFSSALVFSVLALALSSPFASRTARADDLKKDKCVTCLRKVQRDYEKCVEQQGGETPECGEEFNRNIVECYATVCEQ